MWVQLFSFFFSSSPLFIGQLAERTTGFDPHESSVCHQKCVKRKKAEEETPAVLAGVHVNCGMNEVFQKQMENMFHTAYYVVKKEKPFTDFPDLVKLNSRTDSNMPNCYKSDKACSRWELVHLIVFYNFQMTKKNNTYFSLPDSPLTSMMQRGSNSLLTWRIHVSSVS